MRIICLASALAFFLLATSGSEPPTLFEAAEIVVVALMLGAFGFIFPADW